jgi:hypothetical protein
MNKNIKAVIHRGGRQPVYQVAGKGLTSTLQVSKPLNNVVAGSVKNPTQRRPIGRN